MQGKISLPKNSSTFTIYATMWSTYSCKENSKAGIFRHIFMDIGDGQSLINSLSTYTAHLTNMKFFVENNDSETLLLIDEFGGGTEPQIGGAIAETLLERFNSKKSFGLITTHFQNLKYFAFNTDGIINGAMLYDSENNRPMYKLLIGTPGVHLLLKWQDVLVCPKQLFLKLRKNRRRFHAYGSFFTINS